MQILLAQPMRRLSGIKRKSMGWGPMWEGNPVGSIWLANCHTTGFDHERGLPFRLAEELAQNFIIGQIDDRRNYGEKRMIAVGRARGRVLVCIYTDHGGARRIISLRDANRRERYVYRAAYPG
jgi:uncharacterized protein